VVPDQVVGLLKVVSAVGVSVVSETVLAVCVGSELGEMVDSVSGVVVECDAEVSEPVLVLSNGVDIGVGVVEVKVVSVTVVAETELLLSDDVELCETVEPVNVVSVGVVLVLTEAVL